MFFTPGFTFFSPLFILIPKFAKWALIFLKLIPHKKQNATLTLLLNLKLFPLFDF
jgi:hypothetical protein